MQIITRLINPLIILLCAGCVTSGKSHDFILANEPRYASLDIRNGKEINNGIIKMVSYNIRLGEKIDEAIELFKNNEDLKDADIICLQEMDPQGVKEIAESLNTNYVFYPACVHPENNKEFGNAILSVWPIRNDKKILLPLSNADRLFKLQKIAVMADVMIGYETINVSCVHLGTVITPKQRKEQVIKILSQIPDSARYCIITGDFNTYTEKQKTTVVNTFKDAGFNFASEDIGWTYKYWYLLNKKATLDLIFTRGFIKQTSGKVTNRRASDHMPIWSDLKFTE